MRKGRSRGDIGAFSALPASRGQEQPSRTPMDERRASPATGGRKETDGAARGSAACREPPEKVLLLQGGIWLGWGSLARQRAMCGEMDSEETLFAPLRKEMKAALEFGHRKVGLS